MKLLVPLHLRTLFWAELNPVLKLSSLIWPPLCQSKGEGEAYFLT